jgi:hypothetical protein
VKHENQPLVQARGLVVEWRPGHELDDDEYDVNYNADAPRADQPDDYVDLAEYYPIDDDELAGLHDDVALHVVPHALDAVQGAIENDNDDAHKNENEFGAEAPEHDAAPAIAAPFEIPFHEHEYDADVDHIEDEGAPDVSLTRHLLLTRHPSLTVKMKERTMKEHTTQ